MKRTNSKPVRNPKRMKIDKLYLIITNISALEEGEYKWSWLHSHTSEYTSHIFYSMYDGSIGGGSEKCALKPTIKDEYWKKNVEEVVIYGVPTILGKTYLTLVYVLNPSVLFDITSGDVSWHDVDKPGMKSIKRLISETFPDLKDLLEKYTAKRKSNYSYKIESELSEYKLMVNNGIDVIRHKFLDIYFVALPAHAELKNLNDQSETHKDFLSRFEASLNRDISQMILFPYRYIDFIETIHTRRELFNDARVRLIICTKPIEKINKIVIPKSVLELHDFDIKIHVLGEIYKKVSRLPFNIDTLENYISKISKKNIYKNYAQKYKNERLNYIQSKFEIEKLLTEYTYDVKNDAPYILKEYYEHFLIKGLTTENALHSTSTLKRKIDEFDKLINQIERSLKAVIEKDAYVNEYIRDLINVESIWTNLKLQYSVKKLTIITVVLGIVAIYADIYTDEIKTWIMNTLNWISNW